MKTKKCKTPDKQSSKTTTIKTEDGCENVHINMGTGEVTYTPAEDGACELKDDKKK